LSALADKGIIVPSIANTGWFSKVESTGRVAHARANLEKELVEAQGEEKGAKHVALLHAAGDGARP
jgi:hypothetical protein